MSDKKAMYLGDAVYALWDGYGITLRVNDHLHPTDEIYLEPQVLEALDKFRDHIRGTVKR
jgi:hypothetical protein